MKSKIILAFLTSLVILLSSSSQVTAGSVLSDKCKDFSGNDKTSCLNCLDPNQGQGGLETNTWTAIGCLKSGSPKDLVSQILSWAVFVGGGIAFILIVIAGFQITTASGDAKRVKAAQELLTSAISGLILIVLSVLLLNFIGVNILGLNNLGFNIP